MQTNTLPFSQLWVEEEAYLSHVAKSAPPNSVIVEIGTAQGGSAYLFSTNKNAGTAIFSYDIAPSKEAFANLEGCDIKIIPQASVVGAQNWKSTCGKPIDVLFIDGSHTFLNVCQDYLSWTPHARPGATILFHDYDPVERGGVVHLGVRLFVDALRELGALAGTAHIGRIFSGQLKRAVTLAEVNACAVETWKKYGREIIQFQQRELSSASIVCDKSWQNLISILLYSDNLAFNNKAPYNPNVPLLVCERPRTKNGEGLLNLPNAILFDDFLLCYQLASVHGKNRDDLLSRVVDRKAFFKWEEHLEMLGHMANINSGIGTIFEVPCTISMEELSRICARELLRLSFLLRIRDSLIETGTK